MRIWYRCLWSFHISPACCRHRIFSCFSDKSGWKLCFLARSFVSVYVDHHIPVSKVKSMRIRNNFGKSHWKQFKNWFFSLWYLRFEVEKQLFAYWEGAAFNYKWKGMNCWWSLLAFSVVFLCWKQTMLITEKLNSKHFAFSWNTMLNNNIRGFFFV